MVVASAFPDVPFSFQFSAFEDDGTLKRTGLTYPADFTVTVYRDCVVQPTPVTIAEIGSSGEYCLTFTPDDPGLWVAELHQHFSGDICKFPVQVASGSTLSAIAVAMERVLGLLHANSIVDNQVFDSEGQLVSWRLRHFNTPANVPTVPGGSEVTGKLHEYTFEAEYAGVNKPLKLAAKVVL